MKLVRSMLSTKLNGPGETDENIVSKMSKLSSMCVVDVSRQELNNGSFMSKRFVEPGLNTDIGAVEAVGETVVVLNPFEKDDGFC